HGLPTLPIMTRETSPGRYLLEGVRFHMPGRWQLTVTINSHQGDEIGLLDFEL
ncbi:MAG TPA: auxin-binding protein, partial [Gammaproteobacteria bacterium]|nr:auxin-binding protein [Gammaproteobacteria bacterium]